MKYPSIILQRGAVLAFSLVMLLLLTLASTRMIQQNKQQLEIANNTRLLTQEFANAEGLLEEAKNMINGNPVHGDSLGTDRSGTPINNKAHQCEPTADFKQNILLAGTDLLLVGADLVTPNKFVTAVQNGNIKVLAVSCFGVSADDPADAAIPPQKVSCRKQCSSFDGSLITPYKLSTINGDGKECATNICYQGYDPWAESPSEIKGQCPREVYTIQVMSVNDNGTTRKIISDHVVGCG